MILVNSPNDEHINWCDQVRRGEQVWCFFGVNGWQLATYVGHSEVYGQACIKAERSIGKVVPYNHLRRYHGEPGVPHRLGVQFAPEAGSRQLALV